MSCHDEPIDLTADDDDEEIQIIPLQRPHPVQQSYQQPLPSVSFMNPPPTAPSIFTPQQHVYHPPFAGPSNSSAFFPDRHQPPRLPPLPSLPSQSRSSDGPPKVIDLTGSTPSPPPHSHPSSSFSISYEELPPRTPVCIGQLHSQALILYPCEYVHTTDLSCEDWVQVRLEYEYDTSKQRPETLHIKSLPVRGLTGQVIEGERFGFTDHKTAVTVGGMLSKGLVRLEVKVRKGLPSHPVLPLLMLVHTPKGNVPAVGNYLAMNQLMLDHPTHASDLYNLKGKYYHNPHNPPPGGHNHVPPLYRPPQRWTAPVVASKSVEVQRGQLDNIFETMKGNEDLAETEPAPEICTPLYPHQKKALTFLLEREHEKPDADGTFPSLWDKQANPLSRHTVWVHKITRKEVQEEPKDAKGAILADDMGLGKTISCISLIAATMNTAKEFANSPLDTVPPPSGIREAPEPSHFEGAVWGMPSTMVVGPINAKEKAKNQKLQEKYESALNRVSRIKSKSRATLIVCPLSTISNWEDQLREHWKGEVHVIGGGASSTQSSSAATSTSATPRAGTPLANVAFSSSSLNGDTKLSVKSCRIREGPSLRVYVYHGNARRPDPSFLADFDVVMTTYATLASEYSKQNKSIANHELEEDGNNSAGVDSDDIELDEVGNPIVKLQKAKKRKKPCGPCLNEATSPLQSVHWFRVVLDEAHSIKETNTVGCRASCDLMADRRLCLTGTPVQNKLDDVFALIKFLRLSPLDDKAIWTEFVGTPVKFAHRDGSLRLRIVMQHIALRRTKESENQTGQKILNLPPRRDELRYLEFDEQEQKIYSHFFNQSKAEFDELSKQNQVMKNYVGILQRLLRLRQICDHFELVEGKELDGQVLGSSYEGLTSTIEKEGLNEARANAIFWILREAATTQCVECGAELCTTVEPTQTDGADLDICPVPGAKRPRKSRNPSSRTPTRPNSPTGGTSNVGGGNRVIMTRCQHLYCLSCYRSYVCMGWPNVPPDTVRPCSACQVPLHQSDALEIKSEVLTGDGSSSVAVGASPKKKPQKRAKKPRPPDGTDLQTSTKIKSLLVDLMQFSRTNPHSGNYDPSCVEIQMVDEKGNELSDNIVKTVVFSQWTTMLDKVEDALDAAGIRYDRLDGTMKRDERTRAMDALKYDPSCEVLLVSLKAGGVGLNLTAAQRVYLMDPYWNPAVENQAIDRIHRLGQNKPVTTVKLIVKDTIEHRLLEVQKKKTELANLTLGEKGFTKADLLKRRKAELDHMFT